MGIPDTSTTRRLSRVMTRHRPLMTQVPSGLRTSGKRSPPDVLLIPGDNTRRPKKRTGLGSPPRDSDHEKCPEKCRIVGAMSGVLDSVRFLPPEQKAGHLLSLHRRIE